MTDRRTSQPEFDSWNSYCEFAQRVRQNRRYVWDPKVQAFLDTVLATNRNRDTEIAKGSIWWRAHWASIITLFKTLKSQLVLGGKDAAGPQSS